MAIWRHTAPVESTQIPEYPPVCEGQTREAIGILEIRIPIGVSLPQRVEQERRAIRHHSLMSFLVQPAVGATEDSVKIGYSSIFYVSFLSPDDIIARQFENISGGRSSNSI